MTSYNEKLADDEIQSARNIAALSRLTDLAKEIFPDSEVAATQNGEEVSLYVGNWEARLFAFDIKHPRALAAMEAAMNVLAGRVSPGLVELAGFTVSTTDD